MQFVLTSYGSTLFTTTGIPNSLDFVAGSGFGYIPSGTDSTIHGAIVANGLAPLASDTGIPNSLDFVTGSGFGYIPSGTDSTIQDAIVASRPRPAPVVSDTGIPVYSVIISSQDFPTAISFGEIGLFFAGVLVALGAAPSIIPLQNKNVSLECALPLTPGSLGVFSPVALAASAGNINTLPSIDVLPNAGTATTYTQATGVSNSYIISDTGLLAVSNGVYWDLIGGLYIGTFKVDASDFTSLYIIQDSVAGKMLSNLPVPSLAHISATTGLNGGLARHANLVGLLKYPIGGSQVTCFQLTTVAPWTALFNSGDAVDIYVPYPLLMNVALGGQGPAGPIGLTGLTGDIGLTGPTGPAGPIGLTGADSIVPGPTGADGTGASSLEGLFVLDVTPTGTGIVGSKTYPKTVPINRVVSTCITDNSKVKVTVGISGGAASYSPTVMIADVLATVTESSTVRWFTAVADIVIGSGTTTVPVVSDSGATTSVDITLAGAGPNILSSVLGAYPGVQTALKTGDQITVTLTTDPEATEVQLLASGASSLANSFAVTNSTAICVITIGSTSGSQTLTFKAKNSFGTYGKDYSTAALTLDQVAPTFGPLTVAYPTSQSALNTGDTATVQCVITGQTSVSYTAVGLLLVDLSTYTASKLVTLSSTGYVDSGTNYTITAFKSYNGSSATQSGLINIATASPTAIISTSPAGRMVSSPTGINYTVTVTSNQNLNTAPTLTASAGAWAGSWSGSGKVWSRALAISDTTAKGSALFSALGLINLALVAGSTITAGSVYTVGGFTSRTLTFNAFSRVAAIGTTVLDQTKTNCQIVAGNVLTRYADNTVKSNGYYIANADGTFNALGAYVGLSDSVFAGSNTSGTLQITLAEAA